MSANSKSRAEELRRRHRPKTTYEARDRDLDARVANDADAQEPVVEVGKHTQVDAMLFGSQRETAEPVAGKVTSVMRQEWDDRRRDRISGRAARGRVAAKAQDGRSVAQDRATLDEVLARARAAGGAALAGDVAKRMAAALGADFEHVRVHTDAGAAEAARMLGARAFTLGSDIYFADGQYAPGTDAGERLLRHELTHVVQHARGELAAGSGEHDIVEESSAIEVEARAAEDRTTPVARMATPLAPSGGVGAIARKAGDPAPADGALTGSWELHLLNELLKFDLAKAIDAANGEKKLELPRTKIGPVHLHECFVKVEGGKVKSGRVRASLDDGRFKGTQAELQIDEQGHVSGQLNVHINIPNAFVKRVDITLGPDGLHASIPVVAGDFLSQDFTVLTSQMIAELLPTTNLLDIKLEGSTKVKLDQGFANATGTLSASLDGGLKFDASIVSNLNVPGLKAIANATIKWDGKHLTFEAGASLPFDVPGLKGTAKVSYKDHKLHVESKDLEFTWAKLLGLKWGPVSIENGKLKGEVKTGQAHKFETGGAKFELDPGAKLGIDGAQVTGSAKGKLAAGGTKAFLHGHFELTAGPKGLDAAVTLDQATMPGVKLKGVKASIHDVGGKNEWDITAGSIDLDLFGVLKGSWSNLKWKDGLTGDIKLDFNIPSFKIPTLNLKVLDGWKIQVPNLKDLQLPDIDWSKYLGGWGKLLDGLKGIKIGLKTKIVDLSDLAHLIESIDFSGIDLKLPKFPSFSIPKFDFKLPHFELPKLGGGGAGFSELLKKLSGLLKLKIDFSKILSAGEVKEQDISFVDGKPTASGTLDIDVHKLFNFLTGKLRVSVDTAAKDPLTIKGEDIKLANPKLQDWVKVEFAFKDGVLTARADFKKTSGELNGMQVAVLENHLAFDGKAWKGLAKLGANKTGTGSGEVTIELKNGELVVSGHAEVNVAKFTDGYLTGDLKASAGDATILTGKVQIAKGPLAGQIKDIEATYTSVGGGKLTADFTIAEALVAKVSKAIPGITIKPANTPIHVVASSAGVQITGAVTGEYAIPNIMSGTFKAGLKDSVPWGEFSITKLDDKIAIPASKLDLKKFLLKLNELFLPDGGQLDVGFDLGILKGKLHLDVAGGKIGGFSVQTDAATGFEIPGVAKFGLDGGAKLSIVDGKITGDAKGKVALGPNGSIADGSFVLHAGGETLDADITVAQAKLPFLKISSLKVHIKDVAGQPKWSVSDGDVALDLNGILKGKFSKLSWDDGLLGDIQLDFNLPNFKLPTLNLNLLKGWKLQLPTIDKLTLPDIDFSKYFGGFGKLLEGLKGIELGIKWKQVDLTNIGNFIDSLDLRGTGLTLPSFPAITIPKLDLKFPHFELPKLGGGGGGGGFTELLKKLSGLLKLKIDFSKIIGAFEVKEHDVNFVDGQPSASGTMEIDLHKLFNFLEGKLTVSLDTAAKDPFSIKGEGIRLAKPELREWVELDFNYAGGKLSAKAKFKKQAGNLMGFDVAAKDISIGLHDGQWSGSAHLAAAKPGLGAGEVTITYKNGGLEVTGHGTVNAAKVTNGWLTGELKASNEGATTLAGKLNIAKGPLVGLIKDIDATYVSGKEGEDGTIDASFKLGAPLIEKLTAKIPNIKVTPKDAPIRIKSTKDGIDVTGSISGDYVIPDLMSGSFTAGLTNNKPHGEFHVTKLDHKLELPGAKLTLEEFLLKLDEHFAPKDGRYAIGVDIKNILKGSLHLDVNGGKIGGFGFNGSIAETGITKPIPKVGINYDGKAWSGEAKIHFKPLGDVLDDGAALSLKGSSSGFSIGAENVVFKKGILKGFKLEEVKLGDDGISGTIGATGVDLKVGPVKAHVNSGSVTFNDKGFVKGDIKGAVDFTDKLKVDFGVKAHGSEVEFEVATGKPIELSTLSPAITGQVTASYKNGDFAFQAKNVHFTNEKVKDLAEIKKLEYKNGHFDVDLHVSAKDLIYAAGKVAKVVPTALKWAQGIIDGHIEAHAGTVIVKAGWKKGEFFLGAGGEFDLVEKFPAVFSSGKVQAEGDTTGKAKFKILTPIKLIKVPSMTVTSLAGQIEGAAPDIEIGVKFDDLQNLIKLPGLKIKKLAADGHFKYHDGKVAVDGHIAGEAAVYAGAKEIVSGKFALAYENDEFGGAVNVDKVNLAEKYLKPQGPVLVAYSPKTQVSTAGGAISFHAPNIADGKIVIDPADVDLKAGKFNFAADVAFLPDALKQFNLHVEAKNGEFKAGVSMTGAKEVNVGGVQLVIGAGSNLAFDSGTGQVSGRVVGDARVGKIATGHFDLGFNGGDLDGKISAKIAKMPLFKEGVELDIGIKKGMLSTEKDLILELDDKYKKYLDAKVHFKVTNNVVHIGGSIDGINNLGNIGKNTKGTITYDVNTGVVSATGKVPLDGVKFLKDGSTLELYFDSNLNFGMKGHLLFKDFAGANVRGSLDFEWLPGKFMIKGGVDAELKGVAELKLSASSEKKAHEGGSLETGDEGGVKFNLAGKITADGLQKRFTGLKFSEPPAVSFWASGDGGAIEYGMDQFHTKIIQLPGAGKCDVDLQASYAKDKGLDASVQINQLKFGFMKASGGLKIKESKFEEAHLELESDLKAINLKGGIKVHAGEMTSLNAEAELKVVPGEGSSLKWLKEGSAKVAFKDGALATAEGKVILAKPPLLPIEQVEINVFKDGDHIKGVLDTEFKVPMAAEGKKGKLHAELGGDKGWLVHLEAEIAPPGFQNVTIKGDADGSGDFGVSAAVVPKNNKYVKGGSIAVGYKEAEGGFYMGGTVTLAITDDLEGTVGVKYNAGKDDFEFLGEIRPQQKPPDKTKKELGGFKHRVQIPLFSVGVASAGITMKFELESYMVMPYIQFDHLKLSGSLKQLEAGQLPEIDVGIKFGMGAGVAITVGVGISGKVELLVVTAEGGFRGDFTGSADLMIGAAMNGKFGGDRDGLEINVDPTVSADVNLSAALVAFAYASCFGFTIIDEEWKLAEFNLASFQLGSWKPIDPFTFVLGGSNPGFKDGLPSFKKEMPSGLEDGAKKGGEDPEGPERERKKEEAKRKVRIVLAEVKRAGAILDQLPKNWEKGLSLDDMTECDNLLDLGDALDFYRNEADNAEELVPDMKVITTGEKLAKRFADNWFAGALRNYQILNWRRAQIASMGVDPETGVNIVAEREWVKTVQDQRYQTALEAAVAEQTRRLEEWAKDVARQAADFAKAEAAHQAKVQQTKAAHESEVAESEGEGDHAKKDYEKAKAGASAEGVVLPDDGVSVDIPQPKPIATTVAPLVRPLPPPLPPPVVMPVAPVEPPPVHVPALPSVGDIGMSVSSVRPAKPPLPIPEPTPKAPNVASAALPSSEAAAAAGKSVAISKGGGGGGGRGGGGAPPAEAPKPKGKGDPATIPDVGANLGAQHKVFSAQMAALGAGAAPGAGGKDAGAAPAGGAAPAPAGGAAPAAGGAVAAGGAAPAAGGPAPAAGAPGGPAPAEGGEKKPAEGGEGELHPTVKVAAVAGQAEEKQLEAEVKANEAAYKKQIEHEKGDASTEVARLEAARKRAEREKAEQEKEKEKQQPVAENEASEGEAEDPDSNESQLAKS